MGRLFWKFFLCLWLAQVVASGAVGLMLWMKHQEDRRHWQEQGGPSVPPPPPGDAWFGRDGRFPGDPPPPPLGERPPPPPEGGPPHHGGPRFPWFGAIAALVVSLGMAAAMAWYFAKPIRTLRRSLHGLAEGDLGLRVGDAMGRRRDELADLGQDFDRMAGRLEALMNGQKRLLHDVSHELRSPLARLQAAIGLARQQPARLEDSLQRLEREGQRMDLLVGELLTLSRLETGARPAIEAVDMAELLGIIVEDARFEGAPRGIRVDFTGGAEVQVRADGELLHRAVENVVRNALKYVPAEGWVGIEADTNRQPGRLLLAIRDNGPGILEAELPFIFEPFVRGSRAGSDGGYGLGLAIALRVVGSLGGTLTARNRPEGGLEVLFDLPASPLDRPI